VRNVGPPGQPARPVQVPAGNKVAMETVGAGDITYECKAKAGAPGQFEWTFVGPDAKLMDRAASRSASTTARPPPGRTWTAPRSPPRKSPWPANGRQHPLQLVKANPAMGSGAMTGVTYIQRVATKAASHPPWPAPWPTAGAKQVVKYQADYIFYKAM
jgi:hypothetical protein